MLYGFFFRTDRLLSLSAKNHPFNNFPQMCCSRSPLIPHLISAVDQVIPQFSSNKFEFIPGFVLLSPQKEILETPSSNFYLVFYPNPDATSQFSLPVIQEYWKNLLPMYLCHDLSGYYLGLVNDPHVALFAPTSHSDLSLKRITSPISEDLCFLPQHADFASDCIYITRV